MGRAMDAFLNPPVSLTQDTPNNMQLSGCPTKIPGVMVTVSQRIQTCSQPLCFTMLQTLVSLLRAGMFSGFPNL
jgi:hypothetical protein